MKTISEISQVLNSLLVADKPDKKVFEEMIGNAVTKYKLSLQFIDLLFYDERRLKSLGKQKIRFIKIQDFENAATIRDLEKECSAYIGLRKEYRIVESRFELDDEFVFYIHLGTAPNDKKIRRWFNHKACLSAQSDRDPKASTKKK